MGIDSGGTPQLPPGGSWHAGGVTEGASGGCSSDLLWRWYLIEVIDTLCRFYRVVASNGRRKWDGSGRFHLCQSNWLCTRWLPPSWGCAPSHLPPGGRYCGVPPLSMRAQCRCFRSPFRSVTIPGGSGKKRIAESYRAKSSAATGRRYRAGQGSNDTWLFIPSPGWWTASPPRPEPDRKSVV